MPASPRRTGGRRRRLRGRRGNGCDGEWRRRRRTQKLRQTRRQRRRPWRHERRGVVLRRHHLRRRPCLPHPRAQWLYPINTFFPPVTPKMTHLHDARWSPTTVSTRQRSIRLAINALTPHAAFIVHRRWCFTPRHAYVRVAPQHQQRRLPHLNPPPRAAQRRAAARRACSPRIPPWTEAPPAAHRAAHADTPPPATGLHSGRWRLNSRERVEGESRIKGRTIGCPSYRCCDRTLASGPNLSPNPHFSLARVRYPHLPGRS